jgi:hypothetical protein
MQGAFMPCMKSQIWLLHGSAHRQSKSVAQSVCGWLRAIRIVQHAGNAGRAYSRLPCPWPLQLPRITSRHRSHWRRHWRTLSAIPAGSCCRSLPSRKREKRSRTDSRPRSNSSSGADSMRRSSASSATSYCRGGLYNCVIRALHFDRNSRQSPWSPMYLTDSSSTSSALDRKKRENERPRGVEGRGGDANVVAFGQPTGAQIGHQGCTIRRIFL